MKSVAATPWSNASVRSSATATTSKCWPSGKHPSILEALAARNDRAVAAAMSQHIDHMGGMIEAVVFQNQ